MAIAQVKRGVKGRVFTVELDSGDALAKVSVPNGAQGLFLEGTIGLLKRAGFVEDSILELVGSGGILRVDLSKKDLARPSREPRKDGEGRPTSAKKASRFKRDSRGVDTRGRLRCDKDARDTG